MPTIGELTRWIRDYGQDPRQLERLMRDTFAWHQLWSAMDIIDDVDSAMESYLKEEFPKILGERYLRIYGVMQGLFIQQDALADVVRTIHPTNDICLSDILKDIRDLRNASVGHPTQLRREGKLSTHGIVQNSMTKEGFQLFSYPRREDGIFQYVPVLDLIWRQRAEAIRILEDLVEQLRKQEEAYRAQFRDKRLVDLFHLTSYAFEKIFEEVRPGVPRALSEWAVGQLQVCLDDFERMLKQRGINVETYDSINYLYKEIVYPLEQLRKFIVGEQSQILSEESEKVFATALESHFQRLRHIAGEIDEESASEPNPIIQRQ